MSVIKAGHVSTGMDETNRLHDHSRSIPTFQRDECLSFWRKENPERVQWFMMIMSGVMFVDWVMCVWFVELT